ncbi:hypothetical protein CO670_12485 [Rhizobium sp. J15]|nr:hypothetical protein CO670_12485 [Rhizobium sp. J15]
MLVTGIQPRRVCAVNDSPAPKDLGALDSCDKHRNEGEIVGLSGFHSQTITHDTDFSRLPSGSWSIVAAISLVQAETAGTRARSTR